MKKKFVLCIVCVIASVVVGCLLMFAVYALPTAPMKEHAFNVPSRGDVLVMKGEWPLWGCNRRTEMDNFTDALMVETAIYPSHVGALRSAMLNPRFVAKEPEVYPYAVLQMIRAGMEDDLTEGNYGRYWHGYLVVLKPLLYFMSLPVIRESHMLLLFGLMFAVLVLLTQKLGAVYAAAFSIALLLMNPVTLALSMQFWNVADISFIVMLVLLVKNDWLSKKGGHVYVFLFAGIVTAFFDLLTYPLVSLGLPLVIYILLNRKVLSKMPWKASIKTVVVLALAWFFGYAGMWAGKWIAASLITGVNVIEDAANEAAIHLGIESDGTSRRYTIFSAWEDNFKVLVVGKPMHLVFTLLSIYTIFTVVRHRHQLKRPVVLLLGLCSLMPLLWYAVLKHHVIMHSWITFRIYVISVFAILCIGCELCAKDREKANE